MKYKRQPFFIKENVQLCYILVFVAAMVLAMAATAAVTGVMLQGVVEKAVFSAHFSQRTSGEIVRETIIRASALMGILTVLTGVVLLALMRSSLEAFLQEFASGFRALTKGDLSCRLSSRRRWVGADLVRLFNHMAGGMAARSTRTGALLELAVKATDRGEPLMAGELKDIHRQIRQLQGLV